MSLNHTDLQSAPAADWVQRWLKGLDAGARVLDYACGYGRNTRYAIGLGLTVQAVDSDASAVDAIAAPARARCVDLEQGPWPWARSRREDRAASAASPDEFDAVIVCNYLFRPRLDLLMSLVAPSGLLIYETFMIGNERFGRPANPKFLLQPNELFHACVRAGLQTLAFEQGYFDDPKPAMKQRICARRPSGFARSDFADMT
jgi:SAM-dependent methyltransferase